MTTSKPRTIDNLGLDASIRYARDKELYAPLSIEEAQLVSRKTEISVARPYIPSEFDELFSSAKTVIWALFSPPPESLSRENMLFSYQLMPSLGTYERQEDTEAQLEDALEKRKDKRQSEKEKERDKKEKQLITDLLANIAKIDKSIELINSRRNQYQRG
ncbi:MAG TPA: DUF5399 family protein [Chlamydiales bacterium]|nr:DUF5399 family protein [Chlamydiales bacterium]